MGESSSLLCNKPGLCDPSRRAMMVQPPGTGGCRRERKRPALRDQDPVPTVCQGLCPSSTLVITQGKNFLFLPKSAQAGFQSRQKNPSHPQDAQPQSLLSLSPSPSFRHLTLPASSHRCAGATQEYICLPTAAQNSFRSTKVYLSKCFTEPPRSDGRGTGE